VTRATKLIIFQIVRLDFSCRQRKWLIFLNPYTPQKSELTRKPSILLEFVRTGGELGPYDRRFGWRKFRPPDIGLAETVRFQGAGGGADPGEAMA
jgi:hypothetical protein